MAVSLSANVRNRRKGRDNTPIAKARKWAPPPGVDAERLQGRRLPDRRAARAGAYGGAAAPVARLAAYSSQSSGR